MESTIKYLLLSFFKTAPDWKMSLTFFLDLKRDGIWPVASHFSLKMNHRNTITRKMHRHVPVTTSLTSRGPFVVRLKPCPVLLSRTGSLVICSVSLAWKYWLDTLLERCDLPSPSNLSLRRSNKATCYWIISLCELKKSQLKHLRHIDSKPREFFL